MTSLPKDLDVEEALVGLDVPDFDGALAAGTGQRAAIPAPGDAEHVVGVAFEAVQEPAAGGIGEAEETIGAAAGEEIAFGRIRDGQDAIGVQRPAIANQGTVGDGPEFAIRGSRRLSRRRWRVDGCRG